LDNFCRKFKYGKISLAGCGTQTAGLAFGGKFHLLQQQQKNIMEYLGQHLNLNTARSYLAGAGTQTAALGFGGEPTTAATEEYDGTSW
jgi:hypothetical protein